jgi:ElaB/YqjD/DUF883 family membrane-anchored ribosome-binding protein
MSEPETSLDEARDEATIARERFYASLWGVRERVSPGALKDEAIQAIRDRATDAADAVRKRPGLAVGVGAAAILFLLRKPLMAAVKRRSKEKKND